MDEADQLAELLSHGLDWLKAETEWMLGGLIG
jgi:hypothetical protein